MHDRLKQPGGRVIFADIFLQDCYLIMQLPGGKSCETCSGNVLQVGEIPKRGAEAAGREGDPGEWQAQEPGGGLDHGTDHSIDSGQPNS